MLKKRLKISNRKVAAVNPNGKIQHTSGGKVTGLTIQDKYLEIVRNSPFSLSKFVDEALRFYLQDQFQLRLTETIDKMYLDLMMLETLQEKKVMGPVKYTDAHGLQIESYKEVIKILENSPLFCRELIS